MKDVEDCIKAVLKRRADDRGLTSKERVALVLGTIGLVGLYFYSTSITALVCIAAAITLGAV